VVLCRPLRLVVQDVQLFGSALLRDAVIATVVHLIAAFTRSDANRNQQHARSTSRAATSAAAGTGAEGGRMRSHLSGDVTGVAQAAHEPHGGVYGAGLTSRRSVGMDSVVGGRAGSGGQAAVGGGSGVSAGELRLGHSLLAFLLACW
jgi:hypothetical protein